MHRVLEKCCKKFSENVKLNNMQVLDRNIVIIQYQCNDLHKDSKIGDPNAVY